MANYTQSTSVTNLATHTITIPTTDIYSFKGKLTLPNLVATATQGAGGGAGTGSGGAGLVPSQVVITVNQNGSPVYTGQAGALGFTVNALSCTAGDVITIVRSSSLPQDNQLNAIRMVLVVSEGIS